MATKKAAKVAFKPPKSLALCADMLYTLRDERLAVSKQAAAIGEKESILREYLINNLPKSNASGISGKVANVTISTETVPSVSDKKKFLAYVKRTGAFDLITSSMNTKAIRDRWDDGKSVPGIGQFNVVKVSVTKVK